MRSAYFTSWLFGVLLIAAASSHAMGWSLESVTPYGNHADLAVDATGHPHIIFNNCIAWETCEPDGPAEITYGRRDGSGWVFEPIANDPAGFPAAILVHHDLEPHIAYCDSNWQMHYGFRSGGSWTIETLNHLNPPYYRASPSLVLDASGEPHMAFIERETVRYGHKVGGVWEDERVTGSLLDNWSARAAIAFDSYGVLHIGTRKYYSSAEFFTLEPGGWTSELVGGAIAYNPWMVLDGQDSAHFVYHGSGVHYATNASGTWVEELIDAGGVNEGDDIAMDDVGRPFVIFTRATLVSVTPYLFDVELFLAWPENSGWAMELIESMASVESQFMSPRLEIDDFGEIHVLYRRPSSGELMYGTRPVPSAVEDVPPPPTANTIGGITPNPFNPGTEVSFTLTRGGSVTLAVCDLAGRRVRNLLSGKMEQGEHSLVWDGKTDSGTGAPSGVYFFILESEQGRDTRRGVLVK